MITIHFIFENKRVVNAAQFMDEIQILFENKSSFWKYKFCKKPRVRPVQTFPKNRFLKKGRLALELFAKTLAKSHRPAIALFDGLRHLQPTHALLNTNTFLNHRCVTIRRLAPDCHLHIIRRWSVPPSSQFIPPASLIARARPTSNPSTFAA